MKQAIGRARRYGQPKTVNVYHMLVKGTLEINLIQDRREQIVVCSGDFAKFVDNTDGMDDFETCEGEELELELVGANLV